MASDGAARTERRTGALIVAVLFSCLRLGPLEAQAQRPLAGRFEELFANQGQVAPLFTRPEITARLPPLPIQPDENAATAAAAASPPETAQPGAPEPTGVASALKKLIIPPAEAETSPAPPPSATPQATEPQD